MHWAIDFVSDVEKADVELMRETLDAKLKADSGQYGEAARILWELLLMVRHAKRRRWECITMIHMGKVYKAIRWRISVQLFEEALELSEKIGMERARLFALAELGEMECTWGHFTEALELFERALDILDPADLETRRSLLLVRSLAHEGLNALDTCAELLVEVLELDKELDHPDMDEDLDHLARIQAVLSNRV